MDTDSGDLVISDEQKPPFQAPLGSALRVEIIIKVTPAVFRSIEGQHFVADDYFRVVHKMNAARHSVILDAL